jgi:hypothetical protein
MAETEPAFLADAMLQGLARWLRVAGFDTTEDRQQDDPELVQRARIEGRVLLTRDRALVQDLHPERVVLIESNKPLRQLRELVDGLALPPPKALFQRCLRCNVRVRAATQWEIESLFPREARNRPGPFHRCPECGRVYWPGTHTRRMEGLLQQTIPEWFPPS